MKPGHLTTEFYLALAVAIAATVLCAMNKIDADLWSATVGVVSFGYSGARGLAKINPPKEADPLLD